MSTFTRAELLPHLHQKFRVWPSYATPLELELTHISADATHRTGTPLALIFHSPRANPYLPEQVYTVEAAEFGPVQLQFLAIGQDSGGIRYEAIPV
jgi:hypothetical protein